MLAQHSQGSLFKHLWNEIMSIHPGTPDRNKQISCFHLSAVCDSSCNFLFFLLFCTNIGSAACLCNIAQCHTMECFRNIVFIFLFHSYPSYFFKEIAISFSYNSLKFIPMTAASCGSRLVGVMPGSVFASRQ